MVGGNRPIVVGVRPDVHAQPGPFLEIARLGLVEQRGDFVDAAQYIGRRQNVSPEDSPAVGNLLFEIRIARRRAGRQPDQLSQPDMIVFGDRRIRRTPILGIVPAIGLPALQIIGIAKAQVPVPDRIHEYFSSAIFMEEITQAVAVDVFRVFHNPMLIDERIHIDVGGVVVGARRAGPVGRVERAFKLVEVIDQPAPLGRVQIGPGRIVILEQLPGQRRSEIDIVGAVLVLLKNVTARDVRLRIVFWLQLRQIEAFFADFDFLQQHVNASVVLGVR